MANDGHMTRPTDADLERYRKTARSKKRNAFELLKQTRNPEYVALRYGYPVEDLRKALEKIPGESKTFNRSAFAESAHSTLKSAGQVLRKTPLGEGVSDDEAE